MYIDDARELMKKAIDHLEAELLKIRAGKASPDMVSGLMVEYYGSKVPMLQVAGINSTDAKTLVIKPFDKTALQEIEKSILAANIGVTPQNDGEIIRLVLPPLTEERRRDLVKNIKNHAEQTKVSVRNIRRDAIQSIKELKKDGLAEDLEKRGENEIQALTDQFSALVDKHIARKEEEILTV